MIVKSIIYDNLISKLKNLTIESPAFEAYYGTQAGISDQRGTDLVNVAEELGTIVTELSKAKLENKIFDDFDECEKSLTTFETLFNDYPAHRINEIFIIIALIKKLAEAIGTEEYDISTVEIDTNIFCFEKTKSLIHHKNYFYLDTVTTKNSVVLVDLSNKERLLAFFNVAALNVELTALLLSKFGGAAAPLDAVQYALVSSELSTKPDAIYAYVCLHILKAGFPIHNPQLYESTPHVDSSRKIIPSNKYQQFIESIVIASEYNYHKDILDKYLRLYHLLENFMYKYPLVSLERHHGGSVFSIRNFKSMNEKIDDRELVLLTKLIKKVLTLDFNPGVTFERFIFTKWQALAAVADTTKIGNLLILLGLSEPLPPEPLFRSIDQGQMTSKFSQLIYAFRNSLVHNRETEFHLTHSTLAHHPTLEDTAQTVLANFLIPTLEELCFYLIIEKNKIVWYEGSTLTLWVDE